MTVAPRSTARTTAYAIVVTLPWLLTPRCCASKAALAWRIAMIVAAGATPVKASPGAGRPAMIPATAVPWASQSSRPSPDET